MSDNLTPQQQKFIDSYMELMDDPEMSNKQRLTTAKLAAGYSEKTSSGSILKGVSQELVERTYEWAALHLPLALQKVLELLENPVKPGANNLLAAANTIMDRTGLAKVEKLNIKTDAPNAILILPPKSTIKEENSDGI